jgi:Family of unknown function (DUF5752)
MAGNPMNDGGPFAFHTERHLVVLTGRKARNLAELLRHLGEVSDASIFYHTHYLYLTQHFGKLRFANEFADWASHALQEEALAERLAAIDLLAVTSLAGLRGAIVAAAEKDLAAGRRQLRECPAGDEFHFCEAKSFIAPTGLVAHDVPEFFELVGRATNPCLHFHFFEARLRLGRATNDFSLWLKDHGEPRLAQAIDRLDPYETTLDGLREQLVKIGRRRRRA